MPHTLFPSPETDSPSNHPPALRPMGIGFSGTRQNLTTPQYEVLRVLIKFPNSYANVTSPQVVHHGMCVGADAIFHQLVRSLSRNIRIIGHPGSVPVDLRADVSVDELRDRKPPIDRNHDIVDETELLLATPSTVYEILHSGTWSTIRYAHRTGKPYIIILPTGEVCRNYKELPQK